jgi:hypothetical protein
MWPEQSQKRCEVVSWQVRVPGAFGARSSCWSFTPGRRYSTRER